MNSKKILFNYVVQNEKFTCFPKLEKAEEDFIISLSTKQRVLFEKYNNEYSKYYNNRMYYYFCKGINMKL